MKRLLALVLVGLVGTSFTLDADAQRRLGGGRNLGKQSAPVQERQATPPAQQAPAQQAAPAQQPTPAAGAPRPASPWKGALLGLAAGLGLAALASYLGFGETLTAVLMAALIGFALLALVGFVLRRMRGAAPQPAYGGGIGPMNVPERAPTQPAPVARQRIEPRSDLVAGVRPGSAMDEFARGAPAAAAQPWGVPADFDTGAFLARARDYFGRMQAAWDKGDLAALQEFTTQDMFVALTHELRAREGNTQTDVVALDPTLLGIESTATEHLASVRFNGSLRVNGEIERVDEVWNLSKPADGSSGWLLAGIQQLS